MNHKAMHDAAADLDPAVQHAALFERMVGYIAIFQAENRKARQQRIAMVTVQIVRIAAVGRLESVLERWRARQKLILRFGRPVLKALGMMLMMPLHLLQKDHVGLQLMQAGAQLMNTRHPAQAEKFARHPFVNVVRGNPKNHRRAPLRCGSSRMA